MIIYICFAILFAALMGYIRNWAIARKQKLPYPDEFIPHFGEDEDKKFEQQNKERKARWTKKLEEHYANEAKSNHRGCLENFEKEMKYIQAKKALENKYPLKQRSMFEGAFALADMMKAGRERKVLLAELKKTIFEGVDKNGKQNGDPEKPNPKNVKVTKDNGPKIKTPEPTLRKRKVCKEDLEEMPSE